MSSLAKRAARAIARRLRHAAPTMASKVDHTPSSWSDVHIYDLIWNIPETYGGMTSAMLQRVKEFEDFSVSKSLTILTLAPQSDPEWVRAHILEKWGISANVNVCNLWNDLLKASDREIRSFGGKTPQFEAAETAGLQEIQVTDFYCQFLDDNGKEEVRQYRRVDGSLLFEDNFRSSRGRVLTLFASNGKAIAEWTSVSDFYASWLRFAMTKRPGVLINEHKAISEWLHKYSFDGIRVIQVLHGSHLQRASNGPHSALLKQRLNTVRNLERFDQVAVLTGLQRSDLSSLGLDMSNVSILPNSTGRTETGPGTDEGRVQHKLLSVGRLVGLKRVDHAISALAGLADDRSATLDICGSGERQSHLEDLVQRKGIADRVTFCGHVSDVRQRMARASALISTSTTEGFGLVLIEAMAQGCIPIAYDIRYGPSDTITDGENGILVEQGDVESLTAAIRRFIDLPDEARVQMRAAAIARAAEFSSTKNVARWKVAIDNALRGQSSRTTGTPSKAKAVAHQTISVPGSISFTATIPSIIKRSYSVVAEPRTKDRFVKAKASVVHQDKKSTVIRADFEPEVLQSLGHEYIDFFLLRDGDPWKAKTRISTTSEFPKEEESAGLYSTKFGNLSFRVAT